LIFDLQIFTLQTVFIEQITFENWGMVLLIQFIFA
jgi:hypothetical protein